MVVLVPHWSIHNNKGNQQPIKEPHMFDIGLTNLMIYVFLITIQTFYMYLLVAFCNFEVLKVNISFCMSGTLTYLFIS